MPPERHASPCASARAVTASHPPTQGFAPGDAARQEPPPSFLRWHRAELVVLSGRARGMRLSVDQAHTRLGRGPGVDLAFADAALSRTHAVIACDADVLTLRPAGPDVGAIRINGAPLAGVRHVLCDGDILELGAQRFAVSIQARDTSGGAPYQR